MQAGTPGSSETSVIDIDDHSDRLLGVDQDGRAHCGVDQRHADLLNGTTGVDQSEVTGEHAHDLCGHGLVRAGDADLTMALTVGRAHAINAGLRSPGCSRNTWTSSHSRW